MRFVWAASLLLLPLPLVLAAPEEPPCRERSVPPATLVNAAGTVKLCITYPAVVPANNSTFLVSATLMVPQLTGSSPTLDLSLAGMQGCTFALLADVANTPSITDGGTRTVVWQASLLADSCFVYVRARVTSGSTEVEDSAWALNIRSLDPRPDWTQELAEVGLLVWAAYLVICYLVPMQGLRIALAAGGFSFLVLPLDEGLFFLVAVGQVLLLLHTLHTYLQDPAKR